MYCTDISFNNVQGGNLYIKSKKSHQYVCLEHEMTSFGSFLFTKSKDILRNKKLSLPLKLIFQKLV